jgi:transcriptional regulator with XRE-family HTH domain
MAARSPQHLALGEAIRNRRDELERSQEDVSLEAGVDRAHYSGIERGETDPKLSTLLSVASALDIPLWVLERDAYGGS